MRSKRLARQLRKFLGVDDITLETLGINSENESSPFEIQDVHINILRHLPTLLDQVDLNYEQSDKMLELSNRSLEISTQELSSANESLIRLNSTVNSMINSLNEGFVVFDKDGKCTSVSSKRAIEFLGFDPFGKYIWEALKIPVSEYQPFIDWFNYLFNSRFDFEEMAAIGPDKLNHSSLHISIKYKPMLKEDQIAGVILILTDITSEIQSAKRAERFMFKAEMVTKFYADQKMFMSVLDLFSKSIADLKTSANASSPDRNPKAELLRTLHTLKGCSGAMYMVDLSESCEALEKKVKEVWQSDSHDDHSKILIQQVAETLEVSLIDFYKMNKELLGTHKDSKNAGLKSIPTSSIQKYGSVLKKYGDAQLIAKFVEEFYTVPFEQLLVPFESLAYSTAKKLDKEIDINLSCDPTIRIFPDAYKEFFNSFVHLVNNAIDHGIEDLDTRVLLGKPQQGSLKLNAKLKNINKLERIFLTIVDDGAGISPQQIREKLDQIGIDHSKETDVQVINHIFDIGFSTRNAITTISGRGVGLNAVYEEVHRMGGKISVSSVVGTGSVFSIDLPVIKPSSNQLDDFFLQSVLKIGA